MSDKLISPEERKTSYTRFLRELEKEKKAWQLLSVPRVLNTQNMINYLMQLKRNTSNSARLELLDGEIEAVQEMARNGAKEPLIVIKLWEKESAEGERNLVRRVREMAENLGKLPGMRVSRMQNPDIAFLCKQFAELGAPQEDEDVTGEMPVMTGQRRAKVDTALINEITPFGGITFSMNKITLGSTVARVYAVAGYPRELDHSWATGMMNNTEAVTSIVFDPSNQYELGQALSRSIKSSAGEAISERDVRKSKQYARQAQDADTMLDDIDQNNEVIGRVGVLVMPYAESDEELEEVCKRTISLFQTQKIKLKPLGRLQEDGLRTLMPYKTTPAIIDQSCLRLMPLYTLAGGSPMAINSYRDDKGVYFATTSTGNIVSLDLWHRGNDRTSSNLFVLGKSGSGKSTMIKHLIQMEFMKGTKILCIDPDSEYREITEYLGGAVFYAGGGDAKINLLQVRASAEDDEEETEQRLYQSGNRKGNRLAMHIKNTDTIFRSYMPEAMEIEFSLLEKSVIDLYGEFNIHWDTDCRCIPVNKYPTVADLHRYVEVKAEETGNNYLATLASRLYSMAHGTDQFVFNGHTNINLGSQIMDFDTNSLQSQPDNVKRAQYMNILGLAWDITSANPDEHVMLLCDEGYIMIDQKLPQSLMLIRNYGKRCRKVGGALGFITHSVIDLLHDGVRQYGQSILDNATYKFFMGADGKNLQEISELYNLTERQQSILRVGNRGEALSMLGSTVMHLDFALPEYKLRNMGKGGGE